MELIDDRIVLAFASQSVWREWLEKNHETSPGMWLKIAKKASGIETVSYQEALEEALCFGWIDGQKRTYDKDYFVQKFTPRTKRSIWSKRNQEIVAKLIADGRMRPAGQLQIDTAKADGRWEQAYDSPKNMQPPEDFLAELAKNKKAEAFYKTLNKTNTFAISWRIVTAKRAQTRQKRITELVAMLEREEKLH